MKARHGAKDKMLGVGDSFNSKAYSVTRETPCIRLSDYNLPDVAEEGWGPNGYKVGM